jgi:glycosyltransferase involved in cell wall biosynthesis
MKTTGKWHILILGTQMRMGGAQRVMLDLGHWFHGKGYPVKLAFFYDKDGLHEDWQTKEPYPILDLHAWRDGQKFPARIFQLAAGLLRLWKILREERIKAIITFTHHSTLLAIPVAWLSGVPIRIASHRGRILTMPHWQERLHAWLINLGFAQKLVVVSQVTRQQAEEEGVQSGRIVVIPNGISIPHIDPSIQKSIKADLLVKKENTLVLFAGRLFPEKGPDILAQAIPMVIERCRNALFAFAGSGPLLKTLEAETGRMGVERSVRFLGFRNDTQALMSIAKVFVLPSRSEGMPNALIEAMGMGSAVVAADVGGVREIVQNGYNGLLVAPEDPAALANALVQMITDQPLRARLTKAGRECVTTKFTLNQMCLQYEGILVPGHHRITI